MGMHLRRRYVDLQTCQKVVSEDSSDPQKPLRVGGVKQVVAYSSLRLAEMMSDIRTNSLPWNSPYRSTLGKKRSTSSKKPYRSKGKIRDAPTAPKTFTTTCLVPPPTKKVVTADERPKDTASPDDAVPSSTPIESTVAQNRRAKASRKTYCTSTLAVKRKNQEAQDGKDPASLTESSPSAPIDHFDATPHNELNSDPIKSTQIKAAFNLSDQPKEQQENENPKHLHQSDQNQQRKEDDERKNLQETDQSLVKSIVLGLKHAKPSGSRSDESYVSQSSKPQFPPHSEGSSLSARMPIQNAPQIIMTADTNMGSFNQPLQPLENPTNHFAQPFAAQPQMVNAKSDQPPLSNNSPLSHYGGKCETAPPTKAQIQTETQTNIGSAPVVPEQHAVISKAATPATIMPSATANTKLSTPERNAPPTTVTAQTNTPERNTAPAPTSIWRRFSLSSKQDSISKSSRQGEPKKVGFVGMSPARKSKKDRQKQCLSQVENPSSDSTPTGLQEFLPPSLKRFASNERSLKDQINSLTPKARNCLALFRQQWDSDHQPMPGHLYICFGRFCGFNLADGRKLLSQFEERYLRLTAAHLEPQLLTQTLFPVPGLKSMQGLDMFFMRPALFYPQFMKTQTIIDNLAYVMLSMVEKEEAATNGIGMLIYMNEFTVENFSVAYWKHFMKMLQGGVPARVGLVLVVNAPLWFVNQFKAMKRDIRPDFYKKVKMVQERLLSQFLAPGFQTFLPDETVVGSANTTEMVKDFVAYRKFVEASRAKPTDL